MPPKKLPFTVQGNDDRLHTENFFKDITLKYPIDSSKSRVKIIIVLHVLATTVYYLRALEEIGDIVAIIPKGSHKDPIILQWLRDAYPGIFTENISKEYLASSLNAVAFLKSKIKEDEKAVILDIGGYFAPALRELNQDLITRKCLLGIVEDTENGQQKYENALKQLPSVIMNYFPIYSSARVTLKRMEDFNVGKSIVNATDTLLRSEVSSMLERMQQTAVLGVGKVGEGILEELGRRRVKNVSVYDTNLERIGIASSRGFDIKHTEEGRKYLLQAADIIFCATGNKAINGNDWFSLKDNVFIASCTSKDDELDLSALKDFTPQKFKHVSVYTLPNGKKINLLAHGDGINFVYGAVIGPYIHSVQASVIAGMRLVINARRDDFHSKQIDILDDKTEKEIFEIWLKHYESAKPAPLGALALNPQTDFKQALEPSINNNNQTSFKAKTVIDAINGGHTQVKNTATSFEINNASSHTAYNSATLPAKINLKTTISSTGTGSRVEVNSNKVAQTINEHQHKKHKK